MKFSNFNAVMKGICISIAVVFVIQTAMSQSGGFPGTLDLHLVPLPMIDRNPRLRVGMEYHTHHHLGYSLELGWGNKFINNSRLDQIIWGNEYSFFEVRPEIKWYRKEYDNFATYWAAELFYLQMRDRLENQHFYPSAFFQSIDYEEASFYKEKIGLQIKRGIKFLFLKRFVLDVYGGFGIAYRVINYEDLVNPVFNQHHFEEWFVEPHKKEGVEFLAQLSFGGRIGYLIGNW